jgi:hypothetical protein
MNTWKVMLGVNGILLATLLLVVGPLRSQLSAQGPTTQPSLSPCCKTSVEGSKFCCADCCGSGYRCSSLCETKKT